MSTTETTGYPSLSPGDAETLRDTLDVAATANRDVLKALRSLFPEMVTYLDKQTKLRFKQLTDWMDNQTACKRPEAIQHATALVIAIQSSETIHNILTAIMENEDGDDIDYDDC